jgi:hypothetical protein
MTKFSWERWQDGEILCRMYPYRNYLWVAPYPDLGYSLQRWNKVSGKTGEWERIAHHHDLETLKTIAMIYAKGNFYD